MLAVGGGEDSDAAVCDVTCSVDLHDITDCSGNVVKSCPSDQACSAGECVDPCEAAKANKSSIGCEFYSVAPATNFEGGSCFAALLANTWSTPITLHVELNGQALNLADIARSTQGSGDNLTYQPLVNGELAVGQVAVLFLAQDETNTAVGCPAGIKAGISSQAGLTGTGFGKAFHLTTSAPVSAYDIFPYGGAISAVTSATLLIPTSAWGLNYVSADGYPALNFGSVKDTPFTQIAAAEDGTVVTVKPTKAIVGAPGVAATPAGMPQTYALSKGQVLQFAQPSKLAGSAISANKPISAWGGASCMNIPALDCCCDSAHQEFLPVSALGFEHVAARYRNRMPGLDESIPWTLTGTVDGTHLSYTPEAPMGAPLTLESGQVVTFNADTPFTVQSEDAAHPIHLMSHMTSGYVVCPEDEAVPSSLQNRCGDPDFVNNVPPEQWLKSYVFLTDPTYGNTHLVFVRKLAKDGTFKDVTLDCLGVVPGFETVAPGSPYQVARVDLVTEGKPQGQCTNGLHHSESDAPFGLTVWGWDAWVSYAYPAGMNLHPLNTVIVSPEPK